MPQAGLADGQVLNYEYDDHVSDFSRDEGLLVCPVMGPVGTAPKILRVHSPFGFRKIRFSARKRGTPPVFPAIGRDTPSGDVFLQGNLSFSLPWLGGDQGQLDYACAAEYTYAQAAVRGSEDNFQTGRHPYRTDLVNLAVIGLAGGAANVALQGGWCTPTGPRSAQAKLGEIDFQSGEYKYLDTTVSKLFSSVDLIL